MSVYFFNYETGGKDNEKKLSAEQLLTIFNRNIVKNAELLEHIGKEARAKWDFYLDDDQLLPIDGGRKRAMCVKFWRKNDFESLAEWVSKNYKFIDVQKCL
jgi:hypothetical protein